MNTGSGMTRTSHGAGVASAGIAAEEQRPEDRATRSSSQRRPGFVGAGEVARKPAERSVEPIPDQLTIRTDKVSHMDRSDFDRQVVDGTLVSLEGWAAGSNHWAHGVMSTLIDDAPEVAWPLLLEVADRADNRQFGALGAGFLEDFIAKHGRQFIDRIEDRAADDPRFRLALQNVWRQGGPKDVWARIVPLLDGRPDGVEGNQGKRTWARVSVPGLPPGSPGPPDVERDRRRLLLDGVRAHDDRPVRETYSGPVALSLRLEPGPSPKAVIDPARVLDSVIETISRDRPTDADLAEVAGVALIGSANLVWQVEFSRIRRRVEGYLLEITPIEGGQVQAYDEGDSDGWIRLEAAGGLTGSGPAR
jgi:hypothetical protein